jgi:hypothetical protein
VAKGANGNLRAEQFRVVCWNMDRNGLKVRDQQWRYLLDELDPDIALLQEVKQPPEWVLARGGALVTPDPAPARGHASAVYVRRPPLERIDLDPYVPGHLQGYFVAAHVQLPGGSSGVALSVHGPTTGRPPGFLAPYIEQAFEAFAPALSDFRSCLVGGDFNLSRLMDAQYKYGTDHPACHGAFFDRFASSRDLVDCRRLLHVNEKRSLYRRGPAHPDYQLDHLLASRAFVDSVSLDECDIVDWVVGGLSDHAPLVATFGLSAGAVTRRLYADDWREAEERNEIVLRQLADAGRGVRSGCGVRTSRSVRPAHGVRAAGASATGVSGRGRVDRLLRDPGPPRDAG